MYMYKLHVNYDALTFILRNNLYSFGKNLVPENNRVHIVNYFLYCNISLDERVHSSMCTYKLSFIKGIIFCSDLLLIKIKYQLLILELF